MVNSARSGSDISAWTANDLAATISFAAVQTNVTVAFDHFEQIRTAINAILAAQNGAALTWRRILDNGGFPGVPVADHNAHNALIYAADIRALRSAMDAALASVQVATTAYTDSLTSATPIKALHITQLQQRAQ